jgi:hypothetical protein
MGKSVWRNDLHGEIFQNTNGNYLDKVKPFPGSPCETGVSSLEKHSGYPDILEERARGDRIHPVSSDGRENKGPHPRTT